MALHLIISTLMDSGKQVSILSWPFHNMLWLPHHHEPNFPLLLPILAFTMPPIIPPQAFDMAISQSLLSSEVNGLVLLLTLY